MTLETAYRIHNGSREDVDETHWFNLCSCVRSSNLSRYKEPIPSDIQRACVADTAPYNETLKSTYAVESAVVPDVDIPVSAHGSYCLGMASLRWRI